MFCKSLHGRKSWYLKASRKYKKYPGYKQRGFHRLGRYIDGKQGKKELLNIFKTLVKHELKK